LIGRKKREGENKRKKKDKKKMKKRFAFDFGIIFENKKNIYIFSFTS